MDVFGVEISEGQRLIVRIMTFCLMPICHFALDSLYSEINSIDYNIDNRDNTTSFEGINAGNMESFEDNQIAYIFQCERKKKKKPANK